MRREYYQRWELAFLHRTRAMYSSIPWKLLMRMGSSGCSTTEYGRSLMREMMEGYTKREYVGLAAHGYEAVAEAVEADRPYRVDRPALILCGTKDRAGSSMRYSRNWSKNSGIPLHWVEGAGHNSNTDAPDEVNAAIERFVDGIRRR